MAIRIRIDEFSFGGYGNITPNQSFYDKNLFKELFVAGLLAVCCR